MDDQLRFFGSAAAAAALPCGLLAALAEAPAGAAAAGVALCVSCAPPALYSAPAASCPSAACCTAGDGFDSSLLLTTADCSSALVDSLT